MERVPRKTPVQWIPRPFDPHTVHTLAERTHLSPVITQILSGRGVTDPAQLLLFLAPVSLSKSLYPPERLPGALDAAKIIHDAIVSRKKITVYGDYDVDGMTAIAVLVSAIKHLGGEVTYYLPNRLDEGYGLNRNALKKLVDEGTEVVVTVDCGITSVAEAEAARELGLALVITDHHTPLIDPQSGNLLLPKAAAIAHPRILSSDGKVYPYPNLCGAAVALKVAWALAKIANDGQNASEPMKNLLVQAVGLAALGTVADVVPLQDENRAIVRFALAVSLVDHLPVGLRYLIEAIHSSSTSKRITSEDIGFFIAPRLNAAGREVLSETSPKDEEDQRNWERALSLLSQPDRLAVAGQMGLANLGVELLLTHDEARARELAPFINNLNETRQKLERKIFREAQQMIESDYVDDPAFVLASRQWHQGVIGIVAGRLAETYHKPVVMISLLNTDPGTGSARGLPNSSFNLYEALDACKDHLTRFGGHSAAAGLGINEAEIPAFRAALCDFVAANLPEESKTPKLWIDGEYPLATVTAALLHDLERMAPFGSGNARPVFATYGVSVVNQASRMGKAKGVSPSERDIKGPHFTARFRQYQDERRAIAFRKGDWADQINAHLAANPEVTFDIAYQIVFSDYSGQAELRLLDWRVSEA
ncbi:MAG: DHHA1 domain-containing protein [Planctomycetia bacterium]|nr:DHHA1 domain-containing protein [Planctomycetia bacterium]